MPQLLPWNLAWWLQENSSVCFYFSRAQRVISMSLLDLEVGGQWKMNFYWSSSLIVRGIYNWVQKVRSRAPAAASVTLPREHQLQPGSWGEPCTPREQSGDRETSAKP